ncbi:hypothetical protein OO015_13850 (plasmid) [Thermomicrobium sp. 4228-Ro]|uniref:hypothetical protein n=1 Tax=Thermomicrobium sp. 4228-Ro TaxID=2993937 RepID=UPI0022490D30|nr:hypothetical protein [Thermomicrobium sp. 4228-Ro]MCX2728569.1 hypothetical protein [Thermomicrobium sp. 4228-Ro]
MRTVAAMHGGLDSLITALWNRGVWVVAWAEEQHAIVLAIAGGLTVEIERARIGQPMETADMLARYLPRWNVIDAPRSASELPQLSSRTLAWWRFLRWLYERDGEWNDADVDSRRLDCLA